MELGFQYLDGDNYVIDTSGLIKLEFLFPPTNLAFAAIWEEIDDLISVRKFRTIDFVEIEINNYEGKNDFLKNWVKKNKKNLVYETNEECFNAAIPIINEEYGTGFFDSTKLAEGKEEADPYLISYCIINSCTLITSESKTKPNKIPMVAKRFGVKCIDIYDFLIERELKMQRKQKTTG